MRVVLDANVLVSAVISTAGPPREIVGAWVDGRFELLASPALLEELRDVLDRPSFRRWVSAATAAEFIVGIGEDAVLVDDPPAQQGLTADPDDDYLITLARCRSRLPGLGRSPPARRRRPRPAGAHAAPVPRSDLT